MVQVDATTKKGDKTSRNQPIPAHRLLVHRLLARSLLAWGELGQFQHGPVAAILVFEQGVGRFLADP